MYHLCRKGKAGNKATMLALWIMLFLSASVTADTIHTLKAAYIYNISKFIAWPEGDSALSICVVSDEAPLIDELNTLNGKLIADNPIQVYELKADQDINSAKMCNIYYNDKSSALLESMNKKPGVVTISSKNQRDSLNAAINLYISKNRLAFDIDMKLIEEKNVNVSSKLLRLAKRQSASQ